MRVFGIKVLALTAAAAAIYAIGFAIYGLVFADAWMSWSGYTEDSFKGLEWRMALSPVMPLAIALGIGLLMKGRRIAGAAAGAGFGLLIGVLLLAAGRMYMFVYGNEPAMLLALDSAHLVLNGLAAGAVLGAMRAVD